MNFNKGKLNARAEIAMMGIVVDVASPEDLKYMVAYIMRTLTDQEEKTDLQATAESIYEKAMKYNENNTQVSHIVVNSSDFGRMITFVRDEQMKTLVDTDGVLCYVYNIDAIDCSELGYSFFALKDEYVRRIG